jgi:uncharacterized protein
VTRSAVVVSAPTVTARRRPLLVLLAALAAAAPACKRAPRPSPAAASSETAAALKLRLDAALRAKGPGYVPRTRHKSPDGSPRYTNRLILETSPYLLQHAHTRLTGTPGATRRSRRHGGAGCRCFCPSATQPATGAT